MNDRDKDIALAKLMGYQVVYIDSDIRTPQRYRLQRVEQNGPNTKMTTLSWQITEKEAWAQCPKFGEDWSATGMVLEWMVGHGWFYSVVASFGYSALFEKETIAFEMPGIAATPQQAIRDAALKALGGGG